LSKHESWAYFRHKTGLGAAFARVVLDEAHLTIQQQTYRRDGSFDELTTKSI